MRFSVYRFNPEQDAKPYMQDFEIEPQSEDRMLLEVILRLKIQDDTLTFRKFCREGICGSDAMNINGRNGLACVTPVRELREPVVLQPAAELPGYT
jgi:succinate dehydrogenase / fumarate reductase iron-sulfur subunit